MKSDNPGCSPRSLNTSHANSPIPEAAFMMLMFPVIRPSAMAVGATMGEFPDVTWNMTPNGLHAS